MFGKEDPWPVAKEMRRGRPTMANGQNHVPHLRREQRPRTNLSEEFRKGRSQSILTKEGETWPSQRDRR